MLIVDVNRRSQMCDDDLVVKIIFFVIGFFRMIRLGSCLGSFRILCDRFEPPLFAWSQSRPLFSPAWRLQMQRPPE